MAQPTVLILIGNGGVVQAVQSSTPGLIYRVIDLDNAAVGEPLYAQDREAAYVPDLGVSTQQILTEHTHLLEIRSREDG